MGKKIFVAGGAGFIGSALVRQPNLETGASAVNMDQLTCAGNVESLVEPGPGRSALPHPARSGR
jgi:dTDP-glucose 4,6-dehydratase